MTICAQGALSRRPLFPEIKAMLILTLLITAFYYVYSLFLLSNRFQNFYCVKQQDFSDFLNV